MKRVEISNGEIRMGYEINDLEPETRQDVIDVHRSFLCFLDEDGEDYSDDISDDEVIDNIEINGYLFDETGCSLPITYMVKENKIVKNVYKIGNSEYECSITKI